MIHKDRLWIHRMREIPPGKKVHRVHQQLWCLGRRWVDPDTIRARPTARYICPWRQARFVALFIGKLPLGAEGVAAPALIPCETDL